MKRNIIIFALLIIAGCTATKDSIVGHHIFAKKHRELFSVKDCMVYYDNKPLAKYQAKTFSLDDGELVEEYNLMLIDNKIQNKQIIGDLIDFISDRHQGAEVEIEVDGNGSVFKL